MGSYNQQQQANSEAYPAPPTSYPAPGQAYPAYVAPPPAGYPTKDAATNPQQAPVKTTSRGEGFWEGCCAAMCCCCALETCF